MTVVPKYVKVQCACGRLVGFNVFRQHARKCTVQLREWASEGRNIQLLDERKPGSSLIKSSV